ncbi:MAG: transporter substrate-binding domain-containing protein [Clostridia bacterium]|nr:transporter substrate-binding domain-containing protein [Clostridia bacterium]
MKKVLAIFLSILMMFSLLSTFAFAAGTDKKAEVKTIRLGYFSFQSYLDGASEDEPKSGYAYEVLCEVAAINNWKYEFVYGDFNELYKMLLNDEIDILPCLVYTEERAETHLFSDEEIYAEQYYISTLKENAKDFDDISDLNGKRISSVDGTYQNIVFLEWCEANNVHPILVLTPSFDDSWRQLDDGEVDFILNIDNAAQDSGYTSLVSIGAGSSRFAIAPGRDDIRQSLNDAINTIYDINPFALNHIKEKYLNDSLSSYKLPDDEREWLEQHNVIRIAGFENDVPYTYTDKKGNPTGVYPDAVESMFEKLDVDVTIEWKFYKSLQEMHQALFDGEVDLVCPDYWGQYFAQENDVVLSERLQSVNMGLLYGEKTKENGIKRIATPASKLGIYFSKDTYPNAEIIGCNSVDECVRMVASGKADAAIAHVTALQEASQKYLRPFNVKTLVSSCPICFSANHESGMLIRIMNRGILLISDTELQELETKHATNKDYELLNFIRENILFVFVMLLFVVLIIIYAIQRSMTSRKLGKNLNEITRQKEIIEADEVELRIARDAANMASRAKSTFLFNMSHDIRTPMNAIMGYSDRLLRHMEDKEIVADSARKIKSSGDYLLSLINDVLDMARIESDKVKVEVDIYDIKARGDKLCDIFEVDMQKKDLTFNVDLGNVTNRIVWYDSLKLRQIMLNLISNSIKYTPVGGTITHTMEQLESDKPGYGKYRIVVADTGIGMTPEFLEHIFDQFSRSDDSITKETQGTGLGMSIVGKLVDLMGGTIDIQSEVGKGTTITVDLDLKLATEEEIAEFNSKNEAELNEVSLEGLKILLVDDNELNREIAQDVLEEEGCKVVAVAENGQIAVDKVAASLPGDFDVILMDIQMPVMDGYEATRQIRALEDKALASVPIVAMTANAFDEDRQNALDAGMNDHVAKPIDIPKLRQALSSFM